ncbi:MAG TPA: YqgE/AlgH family protein [Stellaceae bacterium]|jgi:putative transcriptional regulator
MRPMHATVWGLFALMALTLPSLSAPTPSDDAGQIEAAPGEFLIAAPEMGDPRFDHAVILLVQHDHGGAFGIIVNRPVEEQSLTKLLQELGQKTDGVSGKVEIYAGGPVESDIGFVLHSAEYHRPETMKIDGKVAVTSSPAVLLDIAQQHGPQKYIVAFGYAGWGAGQLENELAQRAWFIAPGDATLLFGDDPAKLWQDVLDRREQAL